MRKPAKSAAIAAVALATLFAGAANADSVAKGKEVGYDRTKGNCLGCHMAGDGESPGELGPPLIAMKARFPDRAVLRATIWDRPSVNPATLMPPFGKHKALSEEEIDAIVDWLYTL